MKLNDPKHFPVGDKQCDGYQGSCVNHNAERQRQNTNYSVEGMNWVTLCPQCAAENADYWAEMWAEYNSSRL